MSFPVPTITPDDIVSHLKTANVVHLDEVTVVFDNTALNLHISTTLEVKSVECVVMNMAVSHKDVLAAPDGHPDSTTSVQLTIRNADVIRFFDSNDNAVALVFLQRIHVSEVEILDDDFLGLKDRDDVGVDVFDQDPSAGLGRQNKILATLNHQSFGQPILTKGNGDGGPGFRIVDYLLNIQ